MSYRWEIEEDAASAARREHAALSDNAPRRSFRPLVAGLLLLLALFLGWRYWVGQRFLSELRRELKAAVLLEEQAQVGGDAELYLRQQSLARARLLRQAPGLGGERYILRAPLPGLSIQDAPGTILALEPDTNTALGQPIRRATVSLRYAVSDSLGAASFIETRPYVLSPKGRWIHTTPADENPLESDVRHPERAAGGARSGAEDWKQRLADSEIEWKGRYLRARYLPQDADVLPRILARVEALLTRYCRAAEHCEAPARSSRAQRRPGGSDGRDALRLTPVRMRFSGSVPGEASSNSLVGGERHLLLASPALTLAPEDAAAEDLLLRQILRLALLSIADVGPSGSYLDAYGRPIESAEDNALLLGALIDVWLAEALGRPAPAGGGDETAGRLWSSLSPLAAVWREKPAEVRLNAAVTGLPTASRRALMRGFAVHLKERLDADALARLIALLPAADHPGDWLREVAGKEAEAILADWQPPTLPFPADRALLLGCWMDQSEVLLIQPGSRAAIPLGEAACDGRAVSSMAWRPGGEDLALLCSDNLSGPDRGAGAVTMLQDAASATRYNPARAMRFNPARMPAGGNLVWPRGLHWTADGIWLAWTTQEEEGVANTGRLWALAAAAPGAWVRESGRIDLGPVRPKEMVEGDYVHRSTPGLRHLTVGEHEILRPAPVGAALAVELPEGQLAVLDLPQASQASEGKPPPAPRWSIEGSDPQWSPDGSRLAVLRLIADPDAPQRSEARLLVLDAETGAILGEAAAGLPELLIRAAQALDEGGSPELVEKSDIRLRVGDWSPDGRWATLAGGLRVARDDSSRFDPEDGHDWFLFLALDAESGQARRSVARGEIYLDRREQFVRWPEGNSMATLLHVEPLWWLAGLRADPASESGNRQRIASRFDLDRAGGAEKIDAAEALRRPEQLGRDATVSPDGRWRLRPDLRLEGGGLVPSGTAIFPNGETEPAWGLDRSYCSAVEWAP